MTVEPRHHDTHEPHAHAAMPSLLGAGPNERDDAQLRMLASLPAGGQAEWPALLSRRAASGRNTRLAWATGVVLVGAAAVVLVATGRLSLDHGERAPATGPLAIATVAPAPAVAPIAAPVAEGATNAEVAATAARPDGLPPTQAGMPALATSPAPLLIDRPATDPWQALAGLPALTAGTIDPKVTEQRGAIADTARIETAVDPAAATPAAAPAETSARSAAARARAEPVAARTATQARSSRARVPPTTTAARSPSSPQAKVASKVRLDARSKAGTSPKGAPKLAAKRPAAPPAQAGGKPVTTARNDPDVDLIAALIGHMDTAERPPRSPVRQGEAAAPTQPRKAAASDRSR